MRLVFRNNAWRYKRRKMWVLLLRWLNVNIAPSAQRCATDEDKLPDSSRRCNHSSGEVADTMVLPYVLMCVIGQPQEWLSESTLTPSRRGTISFVGHFMPSHFLFGMRNSHSVAHVDSAAYSLVRWCTFLATLFLHSSRSRRPGSKIVRSLT